MQRLALGGKWGGGFLRRPSHVRAGRARDGQAGPRAATRGRAAGPRGGNGPRRPAAGWISDRSFVEHLVEIEQLAGKHAEGGKFGWGERGVGLALSVVPTTSVRSAF